MVKLFLRMDPRNYVQKMIMFFNSELDLFTMAAYLDEYNGLKYTCEQVFND